MKAPEKIYLRKRNKLPLEVVRDEWHEKDPQYMYGSIEYIRTDVFIEKACEYLYQYNRNIVKKHGAKAVLGCSEFTISVYDFRKYMEGE